MPEKKAMGFGWSQFVWNIFPERIARISPFFGMVLQDGRYISSIPFVGSSIGLFGLLLGLASGLADRQGLPYTENLWMLAAMMALGILSGHAGLWAFAGFLIADAFGLVGQTPRDSWLGLMSSVLISWLFLFQLLVGLPYAANQLCRMKGRLQFLNGLAAALLVACFAELWSRLSMVTLRPLFTWQGVEAPLELVQFVDARNEWAMGVLSLHIIAWLALAAGLMRWLLPSLIAKFTVAVPFSVPVRNHEKKSISSFELSAVARSVSFTAILGGLFTSIFGAVVFFGSILGINALRGYASANPMVARWDRLMFRVPTAFRLVLSYALCLVLANVLVGLFRDTFEWRTLTSAAAATVAVFAISSVLWPRVLPDEDAPSPPKILRNVFQHSRKAVPFGVVLFGAFWSTAAFAHHCSFRPGCECLADNFALAALVAAGGVLAHVMDGTTATKPAWGVVSGHEIPSVMDLATAGSTQPSQTFLEGLQQRAALLESASSASELYHALDKLMSLLATADDVGQLIIYLDYVGIDASGPLADQAFANAQGLSTKVLMVVGDLVIEEFYDKLDERGVETSVFLSEPVAKAVFANAIYISTSDVDGAVSNLGGQLLDIASGYLDLSAQNAGLVANELAQALVELDAYRSGDTSLEVALAASDVSSVSDTVTDGSGRVIPTSIKAAHQLEIIGDLQELRVRQLSGEDVSGEVLRLSGEYRKFRMELTGAQNLGDYYYDFATEVARMFGLAGW